MLTTMANCSFDRYSKVAWKKEICKYLKYFEKKVFVDNSCSRLKQLNPVRDILRSNEIIILVHILMHIHIH